MRRGMIKILNPRRILRALLALLPLHAQFHLHCLQFQSRSALYVSEQSAFCFSEKGAGSMNARMTGAKLQQQYAMQDQMTTDRRWYHFITKRTYQRGKPDSLETKTDDHRSRSIKMNQSSELSYQDLSSNCHNEKTHFQLSALRLSAASPGEIPSQSLL